MNEHVIPAVSVQQNEISIFEDPFAKEVQTDIWNHERKKTSQSLFIVCLILLLSNVIGFASADALNIKHGFDIGLFPILFLGLGLFARLQPMVAAIGGIVVIVAITVINYLALGPTSLIAGWLYKTIALYFIIVSIRHANEAKNARKILNTISS